MPSVSAIQKNQFQLPKEITVVCSKKHRVYRYPLEGEFKTWNVKSGGQQSNHYDLHGCTKRNAIDKD